MFKTYDKPSTFKLGTAYDLGWNPPAEDIYASTLDNGWMWTYGNYGWPNPPPLVDAGSKLPWSQFKQERWFEPSGAVLTSRGGGKQDQLHYIGQYVASGIELTKLQLVPTGSSWGAEAYNRMKPTKPEFNGLNALYELRELPKMFEGEILRKGLHAIPDYWLALQFGWRPLLNDIVDLVKTQFFLQKRIEWLLRHNGKPVRRRVNLASSTTQTGSTNYAGDWSGLGPGHVTQFYRTAPSMRRIRVQTNSVWASARFRYWLPADPAGVVIESAVRRRLYGLYPAPQFVYNAIPWSWLADWFSNTGDIISNLDVGVADRLAADYFYVMRETTDTHTTSARAKFYGSSEQDIVSVSATTYDRNTTRSRLRGDPFGFATAQRDLTSMQYSILGALGMSRLR